jgi:hypothetical protein
LYEIAARLGDRDPRQPDAASTRRARRDSSGVIVVAVWRQWTRGAAMATCDRAYPSPGRLVSRYRPPLIVHVHADRRVAVIENGGRRGAKR